jgi:proteasome lid subunit RPN8/RPN11
MKNSKGPSQPPEKASPKAGSPAGSLPAPRQDELRVVIDKKPYAAIIGHAVVEPDTEVCGVLVGRLERDAHGPYVHVSAAIRGEAAKEQGAAVTFTHETWNHIHGEMDRHHPNHQIVGWYHTHGGFGVFLSEMDVFVHDNFFPEPHHVAYVYDPLAGSEAFFHRTPAGLKPVRRYWLGGRERQPAMRLPEAASEESRQTSVSGAPAPGAAQLERAALALQAAADGRASAFTLLPWLVAIGAVLMLFIETRGGPRHATGDSAAGAVVILERDPFTGAAIGIPLEKLSPTELGAFRDQEGNLRPGLILRGPDGTPLTQPGLLTLLSRQPTEREVAESRAKAEASANERASMMRLLAWGGGGVLLVAALLGAAWFFLSRRR